jgi:hypothetical protein
VKGLCLVLRWCVGICWCDVKEWCVGVMSRDGVLVTSRSRTHTCWCNDSMCSHTHMLAE